MTKKEITTRPSRLRTFLRYAWGDAVPAYRPEIRVQPYDEYLRHRGAH